MSDETLKGDRANISADDVANMIRERICLRRNGMSGSIPHWSHSAYSADLRAAIFQAELVADAGAAVTPMEQFRGITRIIALFIGKIVVYLASFITDRQRKFNKTITSALGTIADGMDGLGKGNLAMQEELRLLRNEVEQLKSNLALMSKASAEEAREAAARLHGIHVSLREMEKRGLALRNEGDGLPGIAQRTEQGTPE